MAAGTLACALTSASLSAQNTPAAPASVSAPAPNKAYPQLDVQALIDKAIKEKARLIKLPRGIFRVATPRLEITGATNLMLDGTGTTLLFSDWESNAITLRQCDGVILRGFAMDYDPLPFTQGTIESVSADGTRCEFKVHEGYPRLTPQYAVRQAHAFDAVTRNWKEDTPDLYPRAVEIQSPDSGTMVFSTNQGGAHRLKAGDMVVLNIRKAGAIVIRDSLNSRVEGVDIFSAPGLAVAARFVDGDNYFRFNVKRGPRPAGATQDRLFSTCADGFNYAYARKGPILEKSELAWMGDDAVNLHGVTLPIVHVSGPREFWTFRPHSTENFDSVIRDGDPVRVLAPGNFAIKDQWVLKSWAAAPGPITFTPEEIKRYYPSSSGTRITFYRVTTTQDVKPTVGDWFDLPAIAAPNYIIRDNYFHDHRARGMRLMSSHGLVENNRMERIKQVAITLGPSYAFWREAGWVQDVTVRGNQIRQVCTDPNVQGSESATPGAINVFAQTEPAGLPFFSGNKDVRIEQNRISDIPVAGIHINAGAGILVQGNQLSRTNTVPSPTIPNKYGLTWGYAIAVNNSANVQTQANLNSEPGKHQRGSVQPQ